MDRSQQFRGIRSINTRQWRSSSILGLCLRSFDVVPVHLDFDRAQTRRERGHRTDIWYARICYRNSRALTSSSAEYVNRLLFHTTSADAPPDSIPQWAIQVTAIISVLLVTILCVATPSLGTHAAVVFTTVKVCALVSWFRELSVVTLSGFTDIKVPHPQGLVCILGIIQIARGKASTSFTEPLFEGSSTSPTSYALAFYSGLWAYDGWDQANYVGGEMKNPQKNLPRVIHFSMFLVMVCDNHEVDHIQTRSRDLL